MKELTVATEALELLTSREAREYRLIPFEIKGDQLGCYGEKGYDYENIVMEVEVLTGKRLKVVFLAEEEFSRLLGRHYRQECQARNRGAVSL
ncbi:MAG: type II/IV secretion system protein, partial [Butyricimonas faecihominis]